MKIWLLAGLLSLLLLSLLGCMHASSRAPGGPVLVGDSVRVISNKTLKMGIIEVACQQRKVSVKGAETVEATCDDRGLVVMCDGRAVKVPDGVEEIDCEQQQQAYVGTALAGRNSARVIGRKGYIKVACQQRQVSVQGFGWVTATCDDRGLVIKCNVRAVKVPDGVEEIDCDQQ